MKTEELVRREAIGLLESSSDGLFCAHYLFERIPTIFEADRLNYYKWRQRLGDKLHVDAHDLVMVGSACAGLSLDPWGSLDSFSSSSDIDVAVISERHFEIAWRWIRSVDPHSIYFNAKERNAIKKTFSDQLCWGIIATD